ncbi:MAG: hypothetical protein PSV35_02370, partial [bacterium]|nr:hypothetical protein [bacterium]
DMLYSTLGLREASALRTINNFVINQSAALGWRHAYNGLSPKGNFIFLGAVVPFSIAGVPLNQDALTIDAGLNVALPMKNVTVRLAYMGQVGNHFKDNGATGMLSWKF